MLTIVEYKWRVYAIVHYKTSLEAFVIKKLVVEGLNIMG